MTLRGKDYVVVVADDRLDDTQTIAIAMQGAGMAIRGVMADTGVIFAVLDEAEVNAARAVDGVVKVERCKTLRMLA
jgi:hypothetical protein|nr:hypothetical protein [Neorhizobium tomejilense]